MPAPLHRNFARSHDLEPTHCGGAMRRLFVQAGSRRYYVPIGWTCELCGATGWEADWRDRVAAVVALGPAPTERAA